MPRAVLEIDATTAGIVAAFGQIRTQAQETERVVRASMGNLFAGIPAGSRRAQQSVYRDTQQITRDQERAAQASVRAFVRAEEQKRRAAQLTAEGRARAERQASEIARTEAQRRGLTAEQEARVRTTALERVTRTVEREERQQTAIRSREAARRERDARTIGHGIRRGLNVGRDAAMPVAREAHSQIQDARRARMEAEVYVSNALYQAGGARPDIQAAMRTVTSFAADRSISTDTIARAMQVSQSEFSVFGDRNTSAQERATRLQSFLQTVELGRNVGVDEGEFARLSGLFQNQGFAPQLQRQLLLFAAGASQRGAVEVGSITRETMPAITARIGLATAAARQSGADPQQAAIEAFRQSLAELQVAKGTQGASPREAGNAMRNLTQSLRGGVTQERLRGNIINTFGPRSPLAQSLFEQDPERRGHHRLRQQFLNPLQLISEMSRFGVTADQFENITRGGGHGNPQSLQSNQRRILGNLLNVDQEGVSNIQKVRDIMDPSVALTESDVTRGQGVFAGTAQAQFTKLEEQRINALTEGTSAVVRFSNALDDFSRSNPILSTALQTGGGLVSGVLGSAMINRAGQYFAGNGLAARAFQFLSGTGGEAAVAGEAAGAGEVAATVGSGARFLAGRANPVAAFLTTMLTPSNFRQAAYDDRALIAAHRGAGGGGAGRTAAAMALNRPPSAQEIGNAVAESLRQAPLTAVVSPVDATHAATTAAPRR